jgi:uncharacterized membrane protein
MLGHYSIILHITGVFFTRISPGLQAHRLSRVPGQARLVTSLESEPAMTMQTVSNILIGVLLVGWMLYRQMTWRVFSVTRMWRMPAILAVIGVVTIAQAKSSTAITTLDIVVLIVELAISLAVGALMGRIAVFRTRPAQGDDRLGSQNSGGRRDRAEPTTFAASDGTRSVLESRTGWVGLILWVVLVIIRVGIDFGADQLGATLVTSTGVILLAVAANRIARVLVISQRAGRLIAASAPSTAGTSSRG